MVRNPGGRFPVTWQELPARRFVPLPQITKNKSDVDGIFCYSQFNHTSSMAHFGYGTVFSMLITREKTIEDYEITAKKKMP
jgi:hypothetical protein